MAQVDRYQKRLDTQLILFTRWKFRMPKINANRLILNLVFTIKFLICILLYYRCAWHSNLEHFGIKQVNQNINRFRIHWTHFSQQIGRYKWKSIEICNLMCCLFFFFVLSAAARCCCCFCFYGLFCRLF